MNKLHLFTKKNVCMLFIFTLLFTSFGTVTAPKAEAAVTASGYVYYTSDKDLFRIKTDGTGAALIMEDFDFPGTALNRGGKYLYYLSYSGSSTLMRLPIDGTATEDEVFYNDVLHYSIVNGTLYYMTSAGKIYSVSANAAAVSEAKQIADKADTDFEEFKIIDGKIYYNTVRNGRSTWVASKAVTGAGQVQHIAAGAIEQDHHIQTTANSVNIIVNTKPEEQFYSLDCIVLYSVPKKGGAAKALNLNAPIDANAAYSGIWATNTYYLFNKDIRLDSEGHFNYNTGKGYLLNTSGKTFSLHSTGVYDLANVGTDKVAFIDAADKGYVATIKNNKVISKKNLNISKLHSVYNIMSGGKIASTIFFGDNASYLLKSDLSVQKIPGLNWDYMELNEGVDGIYYINDDSKDAGYGQLFHLSSDGKTASKLSEQSIGRVLLVAKQ
ncbi:hypothetical protein SAMN04487969_12328 [Paenibacillus algorifonticola]|uniref:Prolow-density lipoprotein receptor-related protein 1-like beta-propeller domain-containing protein n=1 Tax=Paenibacillus algorifonticola TaxID=684063 RepID=A0A1I2HIW7_9BACL|nr:DUF5050 domain-containing protein [Paenibacillus algorifonticola]SFF28706.1 hypothetical protein SAMN04487969_12328 [Paenibacillus algorifonticola]